jgi:hypothetical protein
VTLRLVVRNDLSVLAASPRARPTAPSAGRGTRQRGQAVYVLFFDMSIMELFLSIQDGHCREFVARCPSSLMSSLMAMMASSALRVGAMPESLSSLLTHVFSERCSSVGYPAPGAGKLRPPP